MPKLVALSLILMLPAAAIAQETVALVPTHEELPVDAPTPIYAQFWFWSTMAATSTAIILGIVLGVVLSPRPVMPLMRSAWPCATMGTCPNSHWINDPPPG